jgi:O-acetyl-ADP-ribose deacetylase (regulator of RNase III)
VIHAVGPNYWHYDDGNEDNYVDVVTSAKFQKGHELLRSAYLASMDCAHQHQLKQVAFPLLSAGVYRGRVPLSLVLRIGVQAIQDWVLHQHSLEHQQHQHGRHSTTLLSLEHIYVCGFTAAEAQAVVEACEELKLHRDDGSTIHS